MGKRTESSETIDIILNLIALGVIGGVMLAAPNAVKALEKPLDKFLSKMSEKQRRREISKIKSYMKTQGLVRGDYDHGIKLTKKAEKRLKQSSFDNLSIDTSLKWDKKWRLVMFDIPETNKKARRLFTSKLQALDFQILQQSVWIHPYECKEIIFLVAREYHVQKLITYIEVSHIDNDASLRSRFSKLI